MNLTENEILLNNKFNANYFNSVSNLFIISNIGQLNHIHDLIRSYSFDSCGLIILFTSANLLVPQDIENSLDKNVFDKIFFLEIPKSPNRINLKLARFLYEKYNYYLTAFSPKQLYISSFQYHYSLLAEIAINLGAEVALVEEGLGTYRLVNPEENFLEKDFSIAVLKRIARQTLTQTQLFKSVYSTYKPFKEFTVQTRSFLKQVYESPELQAKLIRKDSNKKLQAVLNSFTVFNNTYTSFPSITQSIFEAKEHKFHPVFANPKGKQINRAIDIIDFYKISPNDYIYISQKFNIDSNEYVLIVEDVLKDFIDNSNAKVFIKTHPKRESQATIDAFMKLEELYEGKVYLIKESNFLIEEVIRQSNVKGVIGITSSALVYTPIVSKDCKSYSLAKILLARLDKTSKNSKGINMIESHLRMIRHFEEVIFLEG